MIRRNDSMTNIEVKIINDLFEKVGLNVSNVYAHSQEGNIVVSGILSTDKPQEHISSFVKIKVNLCNKDGEIMYIETNCHDIHTYKTGFDSFSIMLYEAKRMFDIDKVAYIQLYASFLDEYYEKWIGE